MKIANYSQIKKQFSKIRHQKLVKLTIIVIIVGLGVILIATRSHAPTSATQLSHAHSNKAAEPTSPLLQPQQNAAPAASTPAPATPKATTPSSSATIPQSNAAACSYLQTEEITDQGGLQNVYNSDIPLIEDEIQQYNLMSSPSSTTATAIDTYIQSLNNVLTADYQQELSPLQTYATNFGCPLDFNAEPVLPPFDPSASWSP